MFTRRELGLLLAGLGLVKEAAMGLPPPAPAARDDDPLPQRAASRFGTARFWHWPGRSGVVTVAVSPDGRFVASGGDELPIVLWDLATGRIVRKLGGEPRGRRPELVERTLGPLQFLPDGALLAAGRRGRIARWNASTGEALAPLGPLPGWRDAEISTLAIAPEQGLFAVGDTKGGVWLAELASGRLRHRLGPHADLVTVLQFSRDGRSLVSAGWNQSTRVDVWDTTTGQLLRSLDRPPFDLGDNLCSALSPDGRLLAVGRELYAIRVWDLATGRLVASLEEEQDPAIQEGDPHEVHDEAVALAFSPDGQTLISGGRDESVRMWDVATWKERRRLDWAEADAAALAITPDGKTLVAGSSLGTVRVWDLPKCRERIRPEAHRSRPFALAFTEGDRRLVSVSHGAVCVSDPSTGALASRTRILPPIHYAVALADDGRWLAYQGLRSDHRVQVVDTATGRTIRTHDYSTERGYALTLAIAPGSRYLAVGDSERDDEKRLILVYDATDGRPVSRFEATADFFVTMGVSADGRLVATSFMTEAIPIYDATTGRYRVTLHSRREGVTGLAFSPVGSTIASTHEDGSILIWDPSQPEPKLRIRGPKARVSTLAFSPDGLRLACVRYGSPEVSIWETGTGALAETIVAPSAVASVTFARDGRVATGCEDTTVLVWKPA